MYDSATGRFLSQDPLGYHDSYNLYEAFKNNPVNFVDPWGEGVDWEWYWDFVKDFGKRMFYDLIWEDVEEGYKAVREADIPEISKRAILMALKLGLLKKAYKLFKKAKRAKKITNRLKKAKKASKRLEKLKKIEKKPKSISKQAKKILKNRIRKMQKGYKQMYWFSVNWTKGVNLVTLFSCIIATISSRPSPDLAPIFGES